MVNYGGNWGIDGARSHEKDGDIVGTIKGRSGPQHSLAVLWLLQAPKEGRRDREVGEKTKDPFLEQLGSGKD